MEVMLRAEQASLGHDGAGAGAAGLGKLMLRAEQATFTYEGTKQPVLKNINLDLQCGTLMCLMGMNGCGKSTFIDAILGEHRLQAGKIEISGRKVTDISAKEMALLTSYVPQNHERSFPYDVRHVVMMGRTAHMGNSGKASLKDEEAVDAALEACGIARLESRESTTLSGGEMQMVLLARALAQDAPLVLMDEPTAHLDFRNELLFLEAVARLVRDDGRTVLMATHSPNQAFHLLADGVEVQVAVMCDGKIMRSGSPQEVLSSELLRDAFGVEAQVWQQGDMSQVVPIKAV